MYSKIELFGHPIHPMLVSFPVALYTSTLVAYIIYFIAGDIFWFHLAFVLNVAGVLMALVTAVPGFLDWALGIPGGIPAKRHGLTHMILNVSALVIFFINLLFYAGQWNEVQPNVILAILLSLVGFVLTAGAGFFGYTMIQDDHVGVRLTPDQARFEPAGEQRTAEEEGYGRQRA